MNEHVHGLHSRLSGADGRLGTKTQRHTYKLSKKEKEVMKFVEVKDELHRVWLISGAVNGRGDKENKSSKYKKKEKKKKKHLSNIFLITSIFKLIPFSQE